MITLCVTLILFSFMNSTADLVSHRRSPPRRLQRHRCRAAAELAGKTCTRRCSRSMFRLCFVALAVDVLLIGRLLSQRCRPYLDRDTGNELRSELVGYHVRLYKLLRSSSAWPSPDLGGPVYCQQRLCGPHGFRHQSGFRILARGHRRRSGHPGGADAQFCLSISSDVPWHQPGFEYVTVFSAIIIFFVLLCRIELLDHPRALNQLLGLERRTARGGRDSIDHSPGQHDDIANVIAGIASFNTKFGNYDPTYSGWDDTPPDGKGPDYLMQRLADYMLSGGTIRQ